MVYGTHLYYLSQISDRKLISIITKVVFTYYKHIRRKKEFFLIQRNAWFLLLRCLHYYVYTENSILFT